MLPDKIILKIFHCNNLHKATGSLARAGVVANMVCNISGLFNTADI